MHSKITEIELFMPRVDQRQDTLIPPKTNEVVIKKYVLTDKGHFKLTNIIIKSPKCGTSNILSEDLMKNWSKIEGKKSNQNLKHILYNEKIVSLNIDIPTWIVKSNLCIDSSSKRSSDGSYCKMTSSCLNDLEEKPKYSLNQHIVEAIKSVKYSKNKPTTDHSENSYSQSHKSRKSEDVLHNRNQVALKLIELNSKLDNTEPFSKMSKRSQINALNETAKTKNGFMQNPIVVKEKLTKNHPLASLKKRFNKKILEIIDRNDKQKTDCKVKESIYSSRQYKVPFSDVARIRRKAQERLTKVDFHQNKSNHYSERMPSWSGPGHKISRNGQKYLMQFLSLKL